MVMSRISKQDVVALAAMAQIGLTDQEIERMTGELEVIADYASAVSAAAELDIQPTFQSISLENVLRPDVALPPLDRDELLAGAPESEDGMFKVPQILEED